ncbi:MAG: PGPGW domain-containing protein [Terriglobales bacterium]
MRAQVKRVLLLVLGWTFIVVGIAGLFLPVIQGILCLLIGLFILSTEYVWAHHLLLRLKQKFPKIAAQFENAKEKAQRWIGRGSQKKQEEKVQEQETVRQV